MKYRKKPVEIEARQLTPETREAISQWLNNGKSGASDNKGTLLAWYYDSNGADELYIETLEGVMVAEDGDFIIRGVQGEFYPCKPDIFAKTYEPVEFEVVLDEPTPPFSEIPQELLDDPYFKMLTVGNSTIFEGTNP